jgi:hypothetical protein
MKLFLYPFMRKLALGFVLVLGNSLHSFAAEYQTQADIFMVGDIHGAYPELVSILKHAELVDDTLDWVGGSAHFVSTGDLMDRGPSSRKVMDLLIKLQAQAKEAGGQVHVLLGNHEVLNLIGDWRYISLQEYQEFADDESVAMRNKYFEEYKDTVDTSVDESVLASFDKQFPLGFFARLEAFMPQGEYGKWLHTLPIVIKINQHMFTHGGLSVKTLDASLDALNNQLKRELTDYTNAWSKLIENEKLAATTDHSQRISIVKKLNKSQTTQRFIEASNGLLYSIDSPNWYRGNALCHPLFENQVLNEVLERFDANTLWVGHTTSTTVRQRFDNKLILMDTGMLKQTYNGKPIYAHILNQKDEPSQWRFINAASGKEVSIAEVPNRRSVNPAGMNDQQTEEFLLTAEITATQKLGEGITNPMKITLEKDGKSIYAIFKYFDTGNSRATLSKNNSDRFQYEVAAYKLDRLMGINLVPVAVERSIGKQEGALQLWIDDLINYKEMQKDNIKYDGFCNYSRQRQMMDVFDFLIHNEDRNQSNIAFSSSDWQLWFIDHTRSFRTSTRRPDLMRSADFTLTAEFRTLLEALTMEDLKTLSTWLTSKQIRAIFKRRDKLLAGEA